MLRGNKAHEWEAFHFIVCRTLKYNLVSFLLFFWLFFICLFFSFLGEGMKN